MCAPFDESDVMRAMSLCECLQGRTASQPLLSQLQAVACEMCQPGTIEVFCAVFA